MVGKWMTSYVLFEHNLVQLFLAPVISNWGPVQYSFVKLWNWVADYTMTKQKNENLANQNSRGSYVGQKLQNETKIKNSPISQ